MYNFTILTLLQNTFAPILFHHAPIGYLKCGEPDRCRVSSCPQESGFVSSLSLIFSSSSKEFEATVCLSSALFSLSLTCQAQIFFNSAISSSPIRGKLSSTSIQSSHNSPTGKPSSAAIQSSCHCGSATSHSSASVLSPILLQNPHVPENGMLIVSIF